MKGGKDNMDYEKLVEFLVDEIYKRIQEENSKSNSLEKHIDRIWPNNHFDTNTKSCIYILKKVEREKWYFSGKEV